MEEFEERQVMVGMLSKETKFRLIVSGALGVKEIAWLIRKLELDKEILAATSEFNGHMGNGTGGSS